MKELTTKEFAEKVGLNKRYIANLCKDGTIKAEKRGRDWFIKPSEVKKFEKETKRDK